jgi:cytochrome P450
MGGYRDQLSSHSVPTIVLTTTALVLVTTTYYLLIKKRRPKLPYPPGPKGNFLFGNYLDFPDLKAGEPLDVKLLEWSLEYGLVYTLQLPLFGKLIICADPEYVKQIAVTKNYPKGFQGIKVFQALLGSESMVSLNGKEWAAKRKAFNPGFSPVFLKTMVTVMHEKMERFLQGIEQDRTINNSNISNNNVSSDTCTNMLERAQTFTSDVIVQVAFGEDWGGDKPHQARLWLSELARLLSGIIFDPFLMLFDWKRQRLVHKYEVLLDNEMQAILERRLAAGVSNESKDICSLAIHQLKGADGSLTPADKISIGHQLKTFYFAGHDTTAILISWAVWLLSQHAQVLSKVRAELQEHVTSPTPTYEDLQKCTYLDAVLKETLRLYPPAGGVGRHHPDVNESYKGHTMGGALVVLSIYVMQRHPSLWKRPNDFCPERFLDGSEDNLADKFMAFSRGPRDCIGKYFALMEGKVAISTLVTRYNLECINPNDTIWSQLTNVPKHGAKVRFTPL